MATIIVVSADVFASNLISIDFEQPIKNNADLLDSSNYSVVPLTDGIPVVVKKVKDLNGDATSTVYLVVSNFSIGKEYVVTVSNASIVGINGDAIDPVDNTARFIGRRTKIDSMLSSFPNMYDKSIDSILRGLVTAVGREDDLIGGSRKDTLP